MLHLFLTLFAVTPDNVGLPQVAIDDASLPNALRVTFTVVGALAVLFIIIGGIQYVSSDGNAGDIEKAKSTIIYAVIGLIIALSAFVIVQFTAGQIQ